MGVIFFSHSKREERNSPFYHLFAFEGHRLNSLVSEIDDN